MSLKEKFLFIAILAIALFFRVYDINWDQNSHLHPDERFLTMVGVSMKPTSFPNYLNQSISTFNPANIGFNFYVYGIFPVTLNKFTALAFENDNYNNFTIQGRFISALFDFSVIPAIIWVIWLLERKYKFDPKIKYLSGLIYAVSVLPIQLSHFFAVDTFLNSFVFLSFCLALSYRTAKNKIFLIISSLFFGLSIASKATALFALPLILYLILDNTKNVKKFAVNTLLNFGLFGLASYITLRICDPYLFASPFIFDPRPSQLFIKNLEILENLSSKNSTFPPAVQWIHKTPILFPLKNIFLWGFGIIPFLLFLTGSVEIIRKKIGLLVAPLVWILFFFIYQGTRNTTTMRYFILIYPFLSILAGFGLNFFRKSNKIIFYLIFISIFIWPLMFFSIYTKPHSRVSASTWISHNVPGDSVVLSEHWDDALPIGAIPHEKYKIIELPVFDPDTPEKWISMNDLLSKGDYLILSSNRGWGSIPAVPERYPKMSKFYKDLFENKTQYKKIKEFTSYPSLAYLGIPLTLNDDDAEEAFTVYDHPKVIIFKKNKQP